MHNSRQDIIGQEEAPQISRRSILVSAGIAAVTVPAASFLRPLPASAALRVNSVKGLDGLAATARCHHQQKAPRFRSRAISSKKSRIECSG